MEDSQQLQPNRRIVGPERVELTKEFVRRYDQDKHSIRRIAQDAGRSYGFVHRIIVESGVKMRARGGWRPRRSKEQSR